MKSNNDYKGLSGWLILVGIGTVIAPLRLLATAVPVYEPIFAEGIWAALTTVSSEFYHPLWAPLIIGELIFNILMFVALIYLIYLFFSRHYRFPAFYIAILVTSLVFIPLDAWLISFVMPGEPMFDPVTAREFARVLISSAIWVPYMLVSKRVKATFVEKMPDNGLHPMAQPLPD